ncbi:MAG: divalent metal cation transporter [Candidatus Magasanikbacteria bacterium]|nr:divalent metal cation transporter [Candidatus Magasanikbacteria bacterium]
MTLPRSGFKRRLLLFLAVVGPGIITAVADNDAGGVATYTVAASLYGMASQYLIIPVTVLLALSQELGARVSIITGKGLGSLIRERYGLRLAAVVFGLYFIVNQGVILQNVSGLKAALQLTIFPWRPLLIATCVALTFLVIRLSYRRLQQIFLVMILFYLTYVVSAFLANPNWAEALRESLVFPRQVNIANVGYWFSLIAVLGTTITAWGQFFVSSYIVDKGLHTRQLREARWEIYFGAIVTNVLSWLMALAVTYTLFVNRIPVADAGAAALAIRPFAGPAAGALFATGLFGASLLGLSIVPLATSYVFSELFGYERTLNASFKKGKPFYVFFVLQIALGLVMALFPQINLFNLTLYADYLNGAMLPVIFYFLIKFSEDRELVGDKHLPGRFSRAFVRLATAGISLAVIITFIGKLR